MRLKAATSQPPLHRSTTSMATYSRATPYRATDHMRSDAPGRTNPAHYFLNTVMIAEASAEGWGSMGTLRPTSTSTTLWTKDGNPIDLSTRKNSPTSTNSYTPVLTEEEAARLTVRNVLCGNDSWIPHRPHCSVRLPKASLLPKAFSPGRPSTTHRATPYSATESISPTPPTTAMNLTPTTEHHTRTRGQRPRRSGCGIRARYRRHIRYRRSHRRDRCCIHRILQPPGCAGQRRHQRRRDTRGNPPRRHTPLREDHKIIFL